MNFHKTIGYLAAFLLMVGLGAPDSFAQDVKTITVSVDKSNIADNSTEPVTVEVTAEVTLDGEVEDTEVVKIISVTVPTDESYTVSSININVTVAVGETTGDNKGELEFTMRPTGDDSDEGDNPEDDEIEVLAQEQNETADDDPSGKDTITVLDYSALLSNNAPDASGFRVLISSPGNGEWGGITEKIQVRLLRRRNLASEWGNYTSIEVALRNRNKKGDADEPVDRDIYALTVEDRTELGTLILPRVRTSTLMATGSSTFVTGKVTYKSSSSQYDTMDFEFTITDDPNTDDEPNYEKVYAFVTFISIPIGTGGESLSSHDTETQIYPGTTIDVVGDGKFIKLDREPPAANLFASGATTVVTGKGVVQKNTDGTLKPAFIGRYIRTEARLKTVFRNNSVKFELIPIAPEDDGSTEVDEAMIYANFKPVLIGYENVVTSDDLFESRDTRSVLDSVKVNAGLFKLEYAMSASGFDEGDTVERDGMTVRVRVKVRDLAGNETEQVFEPELDTFTLDSKRPKITITYPDSAHHRFTEKDSQTFSFLGEDEEQTQPLNPLVFTSDEALNLGANQLQVIIGDDTLKVKASGLVEDGEGSGRYVVDLSANNFLHTNKDEDRLDKTPQKQAGQAGSARSLKIIAKDVAGNAGSDAPNVGVPIFDATPPKIDRLFPSRADLEGYDYKIGGSAQTHYPQFRLKEEADSILVRYVSGLDEAKDVPGNIVQLKTVGETIRFPFVGDNALDDGESYTLQVYVRDLAKNVYHSPQQEDLVFENAFANPGATKFIVVSQARGMKDKDDDDVIIFANRDSVVADQEMRLTITAQNDDKLTIVTYNESGVKVVAMDADQNLVPSVRFYSSGRKAKGVTDNGDGSATLDSDGWGIGTRDIFFVSEKTAGPFTVVVKELSGDGVVNIMGEKGKLVVEPADFQQLIVSATVNGRDVSEVWGDFDLAVIPTDAYGNPSLLAFADMDYISDDGKGKNTLTAADSLKLLGRRHLTDPSVTLYDDIRVALSTNYDLEGLAEDWPINTDGFKSVANGAFSVVAPERAGRTLTILASVVTTSVDVADVRSKSISGNASLSINEPVEISITLWVPGQDGDQAGNTVTTPAGGESIDVTARAEGLNEGDTVTFTTVLGSVDVTANADGHAPFTVPLSGSGTATVTASSGQYSASLDVVYEEAPAEEGRKAYVDSNGDAVYLIAKDSGTVGVDDFLALVAAFGSSEGDDNYNVQADINDSGSVGVDDFLAFIGSFGKTAAVSGKPIVLLPGINENAEFSLSLGSDGVVAGELMAVDVSLANVEALIGYGFALNYDADKFEFVSVASADEDLLTSTGGETLFHHVVADGQISVATGMYNGTAVSGGGDIVQFVFRVLYEFEDNARFEIADGLVFDPSQLQNPAVVAGVLELQSTPREFALHQNFPNPFNPDTTIKYDLSESADVTLQIYNVLGQVVRTLVASEAQNAGRYQIRWNGMDDRGVSVSSGIYFYRISAGEFQNVRKLMLLK